MSSTSFEIKTIIPATAQEVYDAWLDSEKHSNMTGGAATASNQVGESFTAWDGYISGTNIELVPASKIVQSWRSTEFPDGSNDSRLEVTLTDVEGGCELILKHSEIPQPEHDYENGWDVHYFQPMKEYFG